MFLIQIAALLVLILAISWRFQIRFVESIPVGCSLLVFELYALSFFGRLSFSDVIAVIWLVLAAVYAARLSGEKRKELAGFCFGELTSPGAITAIVMTVIVTVCVGEKAVSWWDDYNFWATDVKSLFYLDGFAGKYGGGIRGLSPGDADDEMVVPAFFPEGIQGRVDVCRVLLF